MSTIPLDIYDDMPRSMRRYLQYNGWHFNKGAFDFACGMMRKRGDGGKNVPIVKMQKQDIDAILQKNGISVDNKGNYDYCYAAMMCKADFYGSSIADEVHMAKFIKDVCDDVDAPEGTIMRRWYATMTAAGVSVPWEEFMEE